MLPESPASQLDPPPVAQYEMLRRIGQGSYGDVWLARGVTGVLRAVKIVWRSRFADPAPFDRELRGLTEFAAMPLGGAHQLAIAHVGKNDELGFFYYVMEVADDVETGQTIDPARYVPLTLSSLRKQRGRLPAAECVSIASDLARGLGDLHRRGLIHRDIKPSNVVFVGGVPKLADIGLLARATEARTMVGTEGYIPPEGPGTMSADVFGLGKLIYELSTGMDLKNFPRLPPSFGELPDRKALLELNEIVLRACAESPSERYTDANLLLADLSVLTAGKSIRQSNARRRGLRVAAKVVGVAAVVAIVALLAWKQRNLVRGASVPVASSDSETEQLLAQIKAFTDGVYTRNGVAIADDLARKATEISPQSARAWGFRAYCGVCQVMRGWDASSGRREDVQGYARRALALDPNEPMALLATAILKRKGGASSEAEAMARQGLKATRGEDSRFWRTLFSAIFSQGRHEEAFALAEETIQKFPKDPLVYYDLSLLRGQCDDFAGFEKNVNVALGLKTFQTALLTKADILIFRYGNLAAARMAFSQIDPEELADDRVAAAAMYLGALERVPAHVHQAASSTANSYIGDFITRGGPKAFWEALAYREEGKIALEREQWQRGLDVLLKRRSDQPDDSAPDRARLATALVWLDRREEAAQEIRSYEATYREHPTTDKAVMLAMYYAALGDAGKAVPFLKDAINKWAGVSYYLLMMHPWWDKLRNQPEFEAFLAEVRPVEAAH